MNTSFTMTAENPPPPPEKTEPVTTPPPLEPEETPIIIRDFGIDSDEEHDIDKTAGDEGIDDQEKDDFERHDPREK